MKIGKVEKLDLLIHSFGGDVTFAWRLVNLIREYVQEFSVIIPLHAFSAATLISLGADSITMLPAGCLGPTDPQSISSFNPRDGQDFIPINTEDIAYFIKFIREDFGVTTKTGALEVIKILSQSDNRIHPLALGHAKRGSKLAEKYAKELLSTHTKKKISEDLVRKIVKTFGSELYTHEHPINRDEAKKLGLNIIKESASIETLIQELFEDYESEMELNDQFDPIFAFKKVQPSLPFQPGTNIITPIQHTITKNKLLMIESEKLTNTYSRELDVTGVKFLDNNNQIQENYSWLIKTAGWEEVVR